MSGTTRVELIQFFMFFWKHSECGCCMHFVLSANFFFDFKGSLCVSRWYLSPPLVVRIEVLGNWRYNTQNTCVSVDTVCTENNDILAFDSTQNAVVVVSGRLWSSWRAYRMRSSNIMQSLSTLTPRNSHWSALSLFDRRSLIKPLCSTVWRRIAWNASWMSYRSKFCHFGFAFMFAV